MIILNAIIASGVDDVDVPDTDNGRYAVIAMLSFKRTMGISFRIINLIYPLDGSVFWMFLAFR